MKRKLADVKDERRRNENGSQRNKNNITASTAATQSSTPPSSSSFALPLLAPTENGLMGVTSSATTTTYKPIAPAIGRTSPSLPNNTTTNGLLHPFLLPNPNKARKVETLPPSPTPLMSKVKIQATSPPRSPPKPKPKPVLMPKTPISQPKRPLQPLQPKLEASSPVPILPASNTRFHPTMMPTQHQQRQQQALPRTTFPPSWPSSPEALAQLELIASCLTPITGTTSQTQMPSAMSPLHPFSMNAVSAMQLSASAGTPLPTTGLPPQLLASLNLTTGGVPALSNNLTGMGLSNFSLVQPLDLNYINSVSKFALPNKLTLNADLAQTHNFLLQNPHLLVPQTSSIDLQRSAFPLQTPFTAPSMQGSVSSPISNNTTNSNNSSSNSNSSTSQKIKPSLIPALKLSIGKWERKSTFLGEVCAKFYYSKKKIVWEIMTLGLMAKMEIEFADIMGLEFFMPAEGVSMLTVQLKKPPRFFGEINPRPGKNIQWTESTDFTGGFGSSVARHVLTFPKGALQKHYEKIVSCDSRIKDLARAGLGGLKSYHFTFPGLPHHSSPSFVSGTSSSLAPIVPATSRSMDALFKAALYGPPTPPSVPSTGTNVNHQQFPVGAGGLSLLPSSAMPPISSATANTPTNLHPKSLPPSPSSPLQRTSNPVTASLAPANVSHNYNHYNHNHHNNNNYAEELEGDTGGASLSSTSSNSCTDSLVSDADDATALSSLAEASLESLTQLAAAVASADSSSNGLLKDLAAEAS